MIQPGSIDAIATEYHDSDVPVHLDGARLCNAAVALDVTPSRLTKSVDSVMLSLSKGLGAPVGSVLAGSTEFIEQAHRHRKLFGGGIRQVGILAAPSLGALTNIVQLEADHANVRHLATGIDTIDGFEVTDPETNIVIAETTRRTETAEEIVNCSTLSVLVQFQWGRPDQARHASGRRFKRYRNGNHANQACASNRVTPVTTKRLLSDPPQIYHRMLYCSAWHWYKPLREGAST